MRMTPPANTAAETPPTIRAIHTVAPEIVITMRVTEPHTPAYDEV
jgi:hypothetical protein